MATRTLSFLGNALHRTSPVERDVHSIVRERKTTAAALIGLTVALGIVLVVTLGPAVLGAYLPGLPVAFVLIWASTDALRFDERGFVEPEHVESEHVEPAPTEPEAVQAPA
jgi:hypothetical protein